eukprot:1545679-Alexandrium_andersonii.AAC.1
MVEGSRICDAYVHGFFEAQVVLLSDAAREQGSPGRPPLCLREDHIRSLLGRAADRALTLTHLDPGLQTWSERLRPGEG